MIDRLRIIMTLWNILCVSINGLDVTPPHAVGFIEGLYLLYTDFKSIAVKKATLLLHSALIMC